MNPTDRDRLVAELARWKENFCPEGVVTGDASQMGFADAWRVWSEIRRERDQLRSEAERLRKIESYREEDRAAFHALQDRDQAKADQLAALRAAYHELLYAVERKFPPETRHQTALRYIREKERHNDPAALAAKEKP